MARAPADGYTLLLANPGPTQSTRCCNLKHRSRPDQGFIDDHADGGVAAGARDPSVAAGALGEGLGGARQVACRARSTTARPAIGAITHLAMESSSRRAHGTDMVHIPYQGANLALTGLIGGQTSRLCSPRSVRCKYAGLLARSRRSASPRPHALRSCPARRHCRKRHRGFRSRELVRHSWARPKCRVPVVDSPQSGDQLHVVQSADTRERFSGLGLGPARIRQS